MAVDPSTFNVSLPKELKDFIEYTDAGEDLEEKVKISLVIGLWASKKITLARAAQLAGKTLSDFIDILRANDLHWMNYSETEWREDERVIRELTKDDEERA
ncbi:putative HTH domain antitoxin [Caldalkalibacillus uzonensis]|uniref:HTH domain antitoxin n=1 Tax=Caldalkalibacillus uzonensis TaxID=353224 RepID=A0ABU0CVY6_9BACI|nr:UPF0175 family protein [Caldalkalibacillus uzonensis]MDQ0340009.1 putative HTH domain antitoxin [Caldalkalibacillus uzonensis]